MTTATASETSPPAACGRTPFLLRRLHSLTGLMFGGYLIVHLLVNATLIQGGVGKYNVYQNQVNKIHDLPFLLGVEWTLIFLPLIYHTVYGIWIAVAGRWNVNHYPYAKNWFYVFQRISAIIIVLFVLFHVLGMKGFLGQTLTFDPENATATAVRHITCSPFVAYVVYPMGILASCYHLANGFWTAAITWGLTVSAAAQRRWGWVCAALFVFTLGCGFTALAAIIRSGSMHVHS